MRVNVYAEELTDKVEVVRKSVNQHTFYGIRMYLKSSPDLHHSPDDNDESAITVWVPWSRAKGSDFSFVLSLLEKMHQLLQEEYAISGDVK